MLYRIQITSALINDYKTSVLIDNHDYFLDLLNDFIQKGELYERYENLNETEKLLFLARVSDSLILSTEIDYTS